MQRHIFLTGSPGIGKSTIVKHVVEHLRAAFPNTRVSGFFTEEVRSSSGRIGFDIVTVDGERAALARLGQTPPQVGRYSVNVSNIQLLALPCLEPVEAKPQIIIIDEVGKMELLCTDFHRAVVRALNSGAIVVGTMPVARLREVESIKRRPDVELLEVSVSNRNELPEYVCNRVVEMLLQES